MPMTKTQLALAARPLAKPKPNKSRPVAAAYVSAEAMAPILGRGAEARGKRLLAADMISTAEAAALLDVSRVTINAWIDKGRVIGLKHFKKAYRLPKWQFDQPLFDAIEPVSKALGTIDGWSLLTFLEQSHPGLRGLTPRQAIEQGKVERVIDVAALAR